LFKKSDSITVKWRMSNETPEVCNGYFFLTIKFTFSGTYPCACFLEEPGDLNQYRD